MVELKRRAIIVDGSVMVGEIAKLLSENGYVVATIFTSENIDNIRHLASNLPIYTFVVPKFANVEKVLEDAGVRSASIVLALSNNDDINLRVATLAREKFGVPKVIVLVNNELNKEKFESIGAILVSPAKCAIGRIMRALRLETTSMVGLLDDVAVAVINVTVDSRLIGKTLEEVERSYDVAVVVRRDDNILKEGSTAIEAGDQLIVIGRPENLHTLSEES